MTGDYVNIDLPGEAHPRRGRLLAEVRPRGSLPQLQIYDSFEYLLALKRHPDGGIEHEEIWRSDDPCDGRCLPVTARPEEEIRNDLRRFFAGDPRAEAFVGDAPLR
jgi:hypothetical protein